MEYIHFANGKSYLLRESNPPKNMNKDEKIQQPESRIKELENNTTELEIEREDFYGAGFIVIHKTKCCKIAPITNENYCPNCGRKIVR